MRVLLVHNEYRERGGEDVLVEAEASLLNEKGVEVIRYALDSRDAEAMSFARLAMKLLWNQEVYRELRQTIRKQRPDIAHFHNTFPLVSAAGYYAAREEGLGVVQTLHNFRLLCVNALLVRDGRPCEACVGRAAPWLGVAYSCYRENRLASAAMVAMAASRRLMESTWPAIHRHVALTDFSRSRFIKGGLPADRIAVLPNFVHPDPGVGGGEGDYALFVGRLSPEKGLLTLLEAWKLLANTLPLKIIGDGPLTGWLQQELVEIPEAEWLGRLPRQQVLAAMKSASFLIVPSIAYENCPSTIVEAMATGIVSVVSGHGALAEIVDHGRTGLHFRPGDPEDLAASIDSLRMAPGWLLEMRRAARREYETTYTGEHHYRALTEIYRQARESASRG